MARQAVSFAFFLLAIGCGGSQQSVANEPSTSIVRSTTRPVSSATKEMPHANELPGEERKDEVAEEPLETTKTEPPPETHGGWDPVSPLGQSAVGAYITGPFVRHFKAEGVIKVLKKAKLNAAVIDMKDGQGRVGYNTAIPELAPQVKPFLGDVSKLTSTLKENGIYTIARITCFADPQLPARVPERAIMHVRREEPWTSWGTGGTWLDPYNEENHRMIEKLALEAQERGFDEVQLDYVRFPVDDGTKYARYPSGPAEEEKDPITRVEVLLSLLKRLDDALSIPLGVDVFGLTAYRRGDPSGLGQDLEKWRKYVEVYSPMLYINAMRNWSLSDKKRPYNLIRLGVDELRERVGKKPIIRPFMQAFGKGAGPTGYNPRFIRMQVQGAKDGRSDGFLFWHPGSQYGTATRGMRIYHGPLPFPLAEGVKEARQESRSVDFEPEVKEAEEPGGDGAASDDI